MVMKTTRPGYVKITMENHHRNSEFSHEKWWIFPVRYFDITRVYLLKWYSFLLTCPLQDRPFLLKKKLFFLDLFCPCPEANGLGEAFVLFPRQAAATCPVSLVGTRQLHVVDEEVDGQVMAEPGSPVLRHRIQRIRQQEKSWNMEIWLTATIKFAIQIDFYRYIYIYMVNHNG